ncbi:NAD-dependent epimerase/dehydratase family protein [Blastopirellula sp. J2-11]|uniref:NAD-dependent epimerase/dehydratase family protein n=1 Tax=Blastopirellula sp. J2-11 TaxID=2943192 RepID=UPI0021CA16B6|nr:NAD-dependent epimerase/dehydratase family protein [Blastopirellula sp. J2-11]UUO07182.1 NAD-dependent epimerase/dehydratase family protein [Blastopirellula sp. J2-11]
MQTILVTGSSGLVGSEVCRYFGGIGYAVHGVDNNQRAVFFGPEGDTRWNQNQLIRTIASFQHHELDIRDREGVLQLVERLKPDLIVHTAAQPSHDRAAAIAFDDFDTNATGALNLLESVRRVCSDSPFVFMSTNKVYGDRPNTIPLRESAERFDYADEKFERGVPESLPIDQCTHSLFGASKAAADLMVQEYGRYFGIPTCCLRAGCVTGPAHSGVQLHGFLSYLVKCNLTQKHYTVFGYQGKQVRDNIHPLDIARFIEAFAAKPRFGEVYNLGGGKENSCSILEAFALTEELTGIQQVYSYSEQNRIGDHICYYSDLAKIKSHYPDWEVSVSLKNSLEQIVDSWRKRLATV